MSEIFAEFTIRLTTTKPQETDDEIFSRSEEVEEIRDKLEGLLQPESNLLPSGWTGEIVE